jgi:hypothetical protein
MSRAILKYPLSQAFGLSVLLFATAIFMVDILNLLILLFFVWAAIGVILGVVSIFIFQMLSMAFKQRKFVYWQAILVVVFSVSVTFYYHIPLSTDARFFLLRPYYESQLAKVQAGASVAEVKKDDKLVAFYWYRGIVDRWIGLIYDPTASLSLPKSIGIFGGLVYKIHHLEGGWYICYFS